MSDESIRLLRDCEAIQIPSGTKITLPKETEVSITQSLGGTYTVVYSQGLARIDGHDADALGMEKTAKPEGPADGSSPVVDADAVKKRLRLVFDPEIPVNIVDLGLVYATEIVPVEEGSYKVNIQMTLTAPGCGMGPAISADAQKRVMELPGVTEANVELVWEPAWNQEMVSEVGKMQLGWV